MSIEYISANSIAANAQSDSYSAKLEELRQKREELNKARQTFEVERAEYEKEKEIALKFIKDSQVIQFNVGGQLMFTSRASVLHIADSKLGQILLETTGDRVSVDKNGKKFLDFNPTLFRHLLEQLRLFEDGEPIVFYPPTTPSQVAPFNAMLAKLGLKPAPESDDDIFTFNVGDEIVQTTRRTLKRVPNSKLSNLLTMNNPADMDANGRPFLDYDPELFRYLLAQIQSGQIADFEAPNTESEAAFNVMLNNFGLKPK